MAILWYKLKEKLNRNRYFLHTVCAGIVFFLILNIISLVYDGSVCPINRFFGKRCFGCGMTRAFRSILVFDFCSAVRYNVLSIPIFIGIIIYILFGFTDIIFGKEYIRKFEKILSNKYMYILYFVLLLAGGYINGVF